MKIATSELEHLREEVKNCHRIIEKYSKQPKQEPLDEEWIAMCWRKSLVGTQISYVNYLDLIRQVERAHNIK
jgi:hypothetical protein